MKAKRLTAEKIKKIHEMLDEGKTIKQVMDDLDVSLRQVTYQVSFRPKRQTLAEIARQAGVKIGAIIRRRKNGLTIEQALTHEKWARYEQSRV